jgi:hypothetical protein
MKEGIGSYIREYQIYEGRRLHHVMLQDCTTHLARYKVWEQVYNLCWICICRDKVLHSSFEVAPERNAEHTQYDRW